jgi:hypothetical protein
MQVQMNFDKIFDKWDISEVTVSDMGLEQHISLKPVSALHTGGRHAKQQFEESKVCIVELLINKMMQSEKNTGKKMKTYKIVRYEPTAGARGCDPKCRPTRRDHQAAIWRHIGSQSRGCNVTTACRSSATVHYAGRAEMRI